MKTTDHINENFEKVFDVLIKKHKKTDISRRMGYTSTAQLNNILNSQSGISTSAIDYLVKEFKVNPTFLFTGVGNMFLNQEEL